MADAVGRYRTNCTLVQNKRMTEYKDKGQRVYEHLVCTNACVWNGIRWTKICTQQQEIDRRIYAGRTGIAMMLLQLRDVKDGSEQSEKHEKTAFQHLRETPKKPGEERQRVWGRKKWREKRERERWQQNWTQWITLDKHKKDDGTTLTRKQSVCSRWCPNDRSLSR